MEKLFLDPKLFQGNLKKPFFQTYAPGAPMPPLQLTPPQPGSRLPSLADRLATGFDAQLHLSPEFLGAMVPVWLEPHYFFNLLSLYPLPSPGFGPMVIPSGVPAPPAMPTARPVSPATPSGKEPAMPRAGTVGDLLKAIGGTEPVKQLQEQAERRLKGDWKQLGTGGQILLGSYAGAMLLGGGTAAYIADPDARKLILQTLRDKPIPIPSTPLSLTILATDEQFTGMVLRIDVGSMLGWKSK